MQPRPTRVLIVDASAAGRARLRASLHAAGGLEVVAEADSAMRGVELAAAVRPDVVMLEADAWLRARAPTSVEATGSTVVDASVPLTRRRRAILSLIAQGLSNREIAARTNLSALTVKGYVEEILQALGARNRVQAAVLAVRRGLIPTD